MLGKAPKTWAAIRKQLPLTDLRTWQQGGEDCLITVVED